MLRRPFIALAAVLVAVVGTGCTDGAGAALRVDGHAFSDSDVLDEVGEWADNTVAMGASEPIRGAAAGSYPIDLVHAVLGFRVERQLVRAEVERRGIEPTQQQRDAAPIRLYGAPDSPVEDAWSDDYAERLRNDIAAEIALEEELGSEEAFVEWIQGALAEADVEVSSRYGRWDPQTRQVVPPSGPVEPAGIDPFAP